MRRSNTHQTATTMKVMEKPMKLATRSTIPEPTRSPIPSLLRALTAHYQLVDALLSAQAELEQRDGHRADQTKAVVQIVHDLPGIGRIAECVARELSETPPPRNAPARSRPRSTRHP